ncbi:hypothetical protein [Persicitalea sp.]|uniref:hypothetical protein n=1 Tax=Persicitalea sp. TaxID=3100273 RepID=UPI0035935BC1
MIEDPHSTRKVHFGSILLVVAPIVLFYVVSVAYSLNIPWFDDIENIPYFLLNWLDADDLSGKLSALFRPNNEHRVVGARLVVLLQQGVTGAINFRVLAFIGNLSVLGIFWLIVRNFRKTESKVLWLLPAALLIFNLQFYAMTFMTIMALQYQLVIFLSFLAFHLLARQSTPSFWLAIAVAWLDTFSMGNGMMVWPSGVVLLLFQGRWKDLGIWTGLGAVAIFLYFSGYDFVQGNEKGFTYILANPLKVLVGLCAMVGGIFDIFPTASFGKRMLSPAAMGAALMGFVMYWLGMLYTKSVYWNKAKSMWITRYLSEQYLIKQERYGADAFWLASLAYLMASMALVVFFRTRFDYELVLWSTYKLYPGCFAAICYLLLISLVQSKYKKYVMSLALFGALLAWGSSYYHFVPEVAKIRKVRQAFAFNQRYNGIGLGTSKGTAFEPMVVSTLQGTAEKGVYQLPSPLVHRGETDLSQQFTEGTSKVTLRETEESVHIDLPEQSTEPQPDRYAVLKSPRNIYLFYSSPASGTADCPKAMLRGGTYKVEIWEVGDERDRLLATHQTVTIR